MIAVPISGSGGTVSGVKFPTLHELFIHNIISSCRHSGIISTERDGTGMYTIQIGNGTQKTVDSVAVFISPLGNSASVRYIIDGVQCCSCSAVKQRIVFRTREYIAV